MKTTIDLQDKEADNRLQALNTRICGSFKDFMTQEDLKIMREDAKWEGK
jgi:hypothetical protein